MIQDHHVFDLGNGYGHFVYIEPPQERILNQHYNQHNITFTNYQKMLEYEIWHNDEDNKERENRNRIVVRKEDQEIVARKEIVERRYQKEEKEDNDENKDHDEENEIILYERMKKIEIIVLISIIVLLNLFYVFFL